MEPKKVERMTRLADFYLGEPILVLVRNFVLCSYTGLW